ncbi:MAG: SLC13 family permease [Sphaerochaetaceae bacterium]|nr:SLC13 family permease [Sphaerochaetaceae bacterium]
MNVEMLIAIILFAATYIGLLIFPTWRAFIALASATIFVTIGYLPLKEVLTAVDWNVIMMLGGTMGIVTLFIESRMPALLADLIIAKMPNVKWAVLSLALFAGIVSAFIDNVATVLMIAPLAITIARKINISPVDSIIAISVSSNLQGAATLVGDTTSILLGGHMGLSFADFFFYEGKIGLFWIVQAGALASMVVLLFLFRKEKTVLTSMGRTVVKDYVPSILLLLTIILLILVSFIPKDTLPLVIADHANGFICMAMLLIGIVHRIIHERSIKALGDMLKEIDWFTLLLLSGLFIVIAGITRAGVVAALGNLFARISGNNVFIAYTIIVGFSVLLSAFIDNIPYVATMLPVVATVGAQLGVDPTVLYFGLLTGATLGGNLTPIGASANIAALGILRKVGNEVPPSRFMRISVPFTLSAVLTGYVLVWLIWA